MSSLSCPSEPPDVGNWFSSYEYQSPNLDSNFTLQDSSFGKRKSPHIDEEHEEVVREKLVHCNETCVKDDNHSEDPCLTKNMDSYSSSSLFSEPPNIRNWFSSYNYESPAFDTCSLLNDEVSDGNKCVEERFDIKVINKDETKSEIVQPEVCVGHNGSFDKNRKGDGSAGMKKNITNASTSHTETLLQPCMQDKAVQHSLGSTKYNEMVNRNHGGPGLNGIAHLMSLDTHASAIRPLNPVQKHSMEEAKLKVEVQAKKLDINTSLSKSFSEGSSACTGNKENDGFVTTRKKSSARANDENSWKKPEKTLLQCSTSTGTVPLGCEKRNVAKRKALTEATNLQQSNAFEITGKWQCPQKRKPDKGPALKQLRLERWVHKVEKVSPQ
ncbi:uncharacterized protein LOC131652350 [Vicia villosa]|uniref:uncharacterized protein LOC131652350 n=1 Tax=Vicia villosa TaxID=3911 RepID=UPI00273AF8AF|nr:uncharacterized protein LOC131652350 [Vicia villosa]